MVSDRFINDLTLNELARAGAHGIVQGGIAEASGGDFKSSFFAGLAGSAAGSVMGTTAWGRGTFGSPGTSDRIVHRTVAAAIVGGTTSELSGGKFSNGALIGAVVHLFNQEGILKSKRGENGWETDDQAAEYGARLIMEKKNQGIEWGFGIFEKDGKFYITEITPGTKVGWSPSHDFFDRLDEGSLVAYLHSHPRGSGPSGEKFSGVRGSVTHGLDSPIRTQGDIGSAYKWNRIDAYLLTPSYKLNVVRLDELPWSPVDFVRKYGYYQFFEGGFLKDLTK